MFEWLKETDRELLLDINHHHNSFWDELMWFASGNKSWIPLYLLVLIVLIMKHRKQSWVLIIFILPLILCSDQLASGILKPLVMRLRPSHQPCLENILTYVHSYRGGPYGFVSSHALNTFSFATYIAFTSRIKWLPYVLYPWAAFVSYSRIYLGVHYPADVVVPVFLGLLLGILFARFYKMFLLKYQTSKL